MNRILILKLEAVGCEAEALFNGVPIARVHAARTRALVPIHEFTLAGTNRLELVARSGPVTVSQAKTSLAQPTTVGNHMRASAHVLLASTGKVVDESNAHVMAQLEWKPSPGTLRGTPIQLSQDIQLPVNFPRWRWMQAPSTEATPALREQAINMIQQFQLELGSGLNDRFLNTVRLRNEELAVAYQQTTEQVESRIRAHLEALHGAGRLDWRELEPDAFILRSVAGGRLLECLAADGEAALRTLPDEEGRTYTFPLRLTAVEGKLYVLR